MYAFVIIVFVVFVMIPVRELYSWFQYFWGSQTKLEERVSELERHLEDVASVFSKKPRSQPTTADLIKHLRVMFEEKIRNQEDFADDIDDIINLYEDFVPDSLR